MMAPLAPQGGRRSAARSDVRCVGATTAAAALWFHMDKTRQKLVHLLRFHECFQNMFQQIHIRFLSLHALHITQKLSKLLQALL